MSTIAFLEVRLLTPWLCGTGRGEGLLHDAVAVKDPDGFPFVPGKHLKGLLRDAVSRCPPWTAPDGSSIPSSVAVRCLFGASSERNERGLMPDDVYFGGLLRLSNASVGSDVRALRSRSRGGELEDDEFDALFFSSAHSTAVDRRSGTAKNKTLRILQVANPITLIAEVEADRATAARFSPGSPEQKVVAHWEAIVSRSLPLVRAIGSSRTRGLGRCILTLGESGR